MHMAVAVEGGVEFWKCSKDLSSIIEADWLKTTEIFHLTILPKITMIPLGIARSIGPSYDLAFIIYSCNSGPFAAKRSKISDAIAKEFWCWFLRMFLLRRCGRRHIEGE